MNAKFNVSSRKEKALKDEFERLRIKEKDISESFLRSQGRGGQHVNKASTCVYLKHIPTGIEVKCSRERSQSVNRFLARRILADKIDRSQNKLALEKKQLLEKIRRQKRKRSKRAKEKMLKEKKIRSVKKKYRGPVTVDPDS